ncbi:hypothetical protein [Pseudomonas aeruginosa]|uniref:hypothetical protein n=1 Tax=Pseudomonas aeruginosa TaxID=287 RepID=UPI0018DFFE7E|nr:hypothetical protein [Pseudomonas aeruginosa]QPZ62291.1 hypothetical protein I9X26_13200 [Pseudomonas aeruginosa]HBO3954676.1 hypothetical protein [Pseudomonas aeruginosa]
MPNSTHLLGNCLIKLGDENLAVVETYFFVVLELSASSEGHRKMFFGDDASATGRVHMAVLGRHVDPFEMPTASGASPSG